jgi:hypothetical protein
VSTFQLLFLEADEDARGMHLDLVVLEPGALAVHAGELITLGIIPLEGDRGTVERELGRWADQLAVCEVDLVEDERSGLVLRRSGEQIVLRHPS